MSYIAERLPAGDKKRTCMIAGSVGLVGGLGAILYGNGIAGVLSGLAEGARNFAVFTAVVAIPICVWILFSWCAKIVKKAGLETFVLNGIGSVVLLYVFGLTAWGWGNLIGLAPHQHGAPSVAGAGILLACLSATTLAWCLTPVAYVYAVPTSRMDVFLRPLENKLYVGGAALVFLVVVPGCLMVLEAARANW